MSDSVEKAIEAGVEDLGYELVELERAGSKSRPILRLRIDRPDSAPGEGVTVEDCTRVSRALEGFLDERTDIPTRYVLEVSSPGIERPLVRDRDFVRFAGQDVAVVGKGAIHGNSRRVEGTLVGLGEDDAIEVRLPDGSDVRVPRRQVKRTHLVYRWGDDAK